MLGTEKVRGVTLFTQVRFGFGIDDQISKSRLLSVVGNGDYESGCLASL